MRRQIRWNRRGESVTRRNQSALTDGCVELRSRVARGFTDWLRDHLGDTAWMAETPEREALFLSVLTVYRDGEEAGIPEAEVALGRRWRVDLGVILRLGRDMRE